MAQNCCPKSASVRGGLRLRDDSTVPASDAFGTLGVICCAFCNAKQQLLRKKFVT